MEINTWSNLKFVSWWCIGPLYYKRMLNWQHCCVVMTKFIFNLDIQEFLWGIHEKNNVLKPDLYFRCVPTYFTHSILIKTHQLWKNNVQICVHIIYPPLDKNVGCWLVNYPCVQSPCTWLVVT
jgi:hypothetical protein